MATATTEAALNTFEIKEGLEGLTPARILTLYRRAPLLRAIPEHGDIWPMFENSSLVLTAWRQGHLVGIARVLTDGVLVSYLCDLAVEPDVQGLGIGKALIQAVLNHCKGTTIVLRHSPRTAGYYQRLGFAKVDDAWVLKA